MIAMISGMIMWFLILGILVFFQWLSTKFDNVANNIFDNIKYCVDEKEKEEERKSEKDFIIPIPNTARTGDLSIVGEVISPANKTWENYRYLEGVVKNNTNEVYECVTIRFTYIFPDGETCFAEENMGYLYSGDERYFRIKLLGPISTYKFLELSGVTKKSY